MEERYVNPFAWTRKAESRQPKFTYLATIPDIEFTAADTKGVWHVSYKTALNRIYMLAEAGKIVKVSDKEAGGKGGGISARWRKK